MGNIRQINIKNVANELLEKYSEEFIAVNFQYNKQNVAELTNVKSILLRNRIAGYVCRLKSPRKRDRRRVDED